MKRRSESEILHQQLELLAEKSKDTYPASEELSKNSLAMASISKELLKRKWLPLMFTIAVNYFFLCITKHGK